MHLETLLFLFLLSVLAASDLNGRISDQCVLSDSGESSVCVLLKDCEQAKNSLKRNQIPQTCGFNGSEPIVCCPGVKTTERFKPGDIANKACEKLGEDLTSTGLEEKIVEIDGVYTLVIVSGGRSAEPKEFKHIALLGFDDGGQKSWQCGGSLISEEYILTAAHCLYTKSLGQIKYVRLGDLDYAIDSDESQNQDFNVSEIISHPNYKYPLPYHDIALLKLNKPVILNDYVKPVCLHTEKGINVTDGDLVVAGWGKTEYLAPEGSSHLRRAKVELVPLESCSEFYPKAERTLKMGIVDDWQVCAGSNIDESNTCQGDSGGPLELHKTVGSSTFTTIIGITSFGKACGFKGIPGVYTRVSNYIEWIENIVWKDKN